MAKEAKRKELWKAQEAKKKEAAKEQALKDQRMSREEIFREIININNELDGKNLSKERVKELEKRLAELEKLNK